MKFLMLLLVIIANLSCASNDSKDDDLKWKVTQLENRIDSLILALRNPNQKNNSLYNTPYAAPTLKSNKQQGYSTQCIAITKKGYRCSRKTKSGSYCWQHGG